MMAGLFSSFDPSNSSNLLILMTPILFSIIFLESKSKIIKTIKIPQTIFTKEMNNISKNTIMKKIFSSIFLLISTVNLFSMTPSSFTLSAQAFFVLPLSLIPFSMVMMNSMKNSTKKTMAHFTPKGSPLVLSPILVIIELTSTIIRPITLSVRLISNMMAGHLMLHLITKMFISMKFLLILTLTLSMTLISVELAISLIQAYIFCILLSIYLEE